MSLFTGMIAGSLQPATASQGGAAMANALARRHRAGWDETLLLPIGLEFEPEEDEDWDEEDEDWD
jgi:hypothetical protein